MDRISEQAITDTHARRSVRRLPIRQLQGKSVSDYQRKIETTYEGDPADWRKAIGEYLLFQFGVYDDPRSTPPISLDESGIRYFERQLHLAGFDEPDHPSVERILDIGCGWGYILKYLADRFPHCMRLDGVNVSREQLEYCAQLHAKHGLEDRINLYQCNAQDVDLLPDAATPYDLVIIRGVISHFPNALYEKAMKALYPRVRPGGSVVISDNLYNVALDDYRSDTPDDVDRIACKHRKTPDYFAKVLTDAGFTLHDMRVLPSNIDVARWLMDSKANIEKHFPQGATGTLEELRVLAENWSVALIKNKVSTYSVIVTRPAA
ncbi:methyltransferase domain-containing protein [Burkholderia territorii]|uniref:Methyltransferase domain-containing protein n=1 Tax=Burkholderia territorii TaxID=1503055 RepID=A0A6L3NMB0_9BURK|nr:class I SAM-dependent methyltransferase [Burkholderia territorii]KAB0685628.1 methyltransferase domain-containing protein [Burkholderia territorii]KVT79098.1 methyltransferase type 12 [Burkholderia territorii]MBM2775744.1 methyltransferase domain-containing protein [Burkholderia territorii]VWB94313.1 methyltransferase type 12 [Burkholderia territorii]